MKILNYLLNAKAITFAFLVFIYLWIGYKLYFIDASGDGFIFGDWLINYQDGGFKRRGLSGSLLFLIQDITGVKLLYLVYFTQMFLYSTFFLLIIKILIKKRVNLLYFSLMLSPLVFSNYFNQNDFAGRKEIILFNIFALYIYLIYKNKLPLYREYLICILLFIATFLHEITIFYVPYFILAHFLLYKNPNIKKYLLFFLSCFIPALLIFVFGAKINEGESLSILALRGVTLESHSIFSPMGGLLQDVVHYTENPIGYLLYLPTLLLGTTHFAFYMKRETHLNYKKVLVYFSLIFAYSTPLFILACDWGRWLQFHFVLLLLILTFKLPSIVNEGDWEGSKLILNRKNLTYAMFLPFLVMWQVYLLEWGFWLRGINWFIDVLS